MDLVTLQLGKRGVTPEFLEEVGLALKKHKRVRVRMLKSSLKGADKRRIIESIVQHACAGKVSCRGNTLVIEAG